MIERKIKLSDTEEVKDFVNAAGKCDFEIDVCYSRAVIDAKSLLGMLYLGVCKELTIKYGEKDARFEKVVGKYAIAYHMSSRKFEEGMLSTFDLHTAAQTLLESRIKELQMQLLLIIKQRLVAYYQGENLIR